ncbi:MAG: hypothetical protein ACTSPB_21720 [Candidatus Thorarchaeota archaeon]
MEKREFWIQCVCGSEGLHIEKDEYDGDVYIAMWVYGQQNMSIMHKLHWIWRIIQGKPWADHIVVDNLQLQVIIDGLENMKDEVRRGELG